MQEIKEHLQSGKTVKEIIDLGFKQPTIYKVKRKLSENNELVDQEQNPPVNGPAGGPDPEPDPDPEPELEPFLEETGEIPDTTQDLNTIEPDNTTSNSVIDNIPETEDAEPIEMEIFSDEEHPFRQYDGVGIRSTDINIPVSSTIFPDTKTQTPSKTGQLGLSELLSEVFSVVGALTGHEFWELSTKEKKVIKQLCKIPGLEKFLHKFGLYGCAIGLFSITFKRIKAELILKKNVNPEIEPPQEQKVTEMTFPDTPTSIMEGL